VAPFHFGIWQPARYARCATNPGSGVVICFQSPTVNAQPRSVFLQARRSAHLHPPGPSRAYNAVRERSLCRRREHPV